MIFCLATFMSALASSGISKDDNIIISDETRIYTLNEKNGKISSVKLESETSFEALKADGIAIETAITNSHISIDKASAPGTKPYYRTLESEDVFYDGSRVCLLQIPVAKGKKVKATIQQTFKSPEHFCNIFFCSGKYFTNHSKVIIKVPSSLADAIKITPYDFPDNISLTSETSANGIITYIAEANELEPWLDEDEAPSAAVAAPRLIITGQFANTKDMYQYFRNFCEDPDLEDPEICKTAALIKEKADSPIAIIDSTAAWVRQNIRYLAVEHGEYAFKPSAASETIRSRAGDCKASANLIKTLLMKNGLDGRLVWIGTQGDIAYDWDKVPALCSGNHVIAACMLKDSIIYLDGTTSWASPGYIPHSIRGRQTIIEDGENFIISRVPDAGREADTEYRHSSYSIDGNDLVGNVSIKMSGIHKMTFLGMLSHFEPRDRRTVINKFVSNAKKNSDVYNVAVDADLSHQYVEISAGMREGNAAQNIGNKIYIDLKPIRDIFFETVDVGKRTHDLLLPFPYSINHNFDITIPEGYMIEHLPESISITNEWHDASINYSAENGVISCKVSISSKGLITPLNRIPERNEQIKAIRRVSDSKIVISKILPSS